MSDDIDAAIELQLDVMRVSASARADVLKILRRMEREIVGKIAGENLTAWGRARLNKQLSEIQATIKDYYAQASASAIGVTDDVARVAVSVTAGGLTASAVLPSATVIESIASSAVVQGAAQGAWWAKQSDDVAFQFSRAVRQGLASAETNQQIINRVRQVMDVSRKNAATLVQTSVATVANDARMAVFAANEDIIKRYRALATLDSKTCLFCAPRDGKEWMPNGDPIGHSFPLPTYPLHMNCLTGDALVTSVDDVSGVSKRWFDGDVIVIRTAGNRVLTCTPNHPILTSMGWVAAGLLDVGGDVICNIFSEREGLRGGDHENRPSTIHDFSEAFVSSGKMMPVPVPLTASDFHGDGEGSKVAIVHSNRLLVGGLNSSGRKHCLKFEFIIRGMNVLRSLSGLGGHFKSFPASLSSSGGFIGLAHKAFDLLRRRASHSCKLLLASVSGRYSPIPENALYNQSGNSEGISNAFNPNAGIEHCNCGWLVNFDQLPAGIDSGSFEDSKGDIVGDSALARSLLDGSAGKVCADEIVSCERVNFSGHVYNLETDKGWYVANGIVTHNCRCLLLGRPFIGEPGGARATADGPVEAKTTFEDWLKRQPDEKVESILGKERAKMFLDGKLSLDDLVNGNGKPLSVADLRSKYGLSDAGQGVAAPSGQRLMDMDAKNQAVRQEIFDLGQKKDVEYIGAYDSRADKTFAIGTDNKKSSVNMTQEMVSHIEQNGGSMFSLHHNHPSGSSLSADDLSLASRWGIGRVYAHGKNGSSYAARVIDSGSLPFAMRDTMALVDSAVKRVPKADRLMQEMVMVHRNHLENMVLAKKGVIEYDYSMGERPIINYSKVSEKFDALAEAIAGKLKL